MRLLDFLGFKKTLFLDRDGVINKKIDGYIAKPSELEFIPNVLSAIGVLSTIFETIVIVTNQQGIGKGLMTHDDLHSIHSHMMRHITLSGGRIDNIYYCPHLASEDSPCRKPNPGMALQAKADFANIDFRESIMIGDSDSDILFGNQLNMTTVRISTFEDSSADYTCSSLSDFVTYYTEN